MSNLLSSKISTFPIAENSFSALASCSSETNFPLHKAVAPSRTRAGVFGIARITPASLPMLSSMKLVEMPAAIEMIIALFFINCFISSKTSGIFCGFTERKIISAPIIASPLFSAIEIPYFFCKFSTFSFDMSLQKRFPS